MAHTEMNFLSIIQSGLEHEIKERISTEIINHAVNTLKIELKDKLDEFLNSVVFERIDCFERADMLRKELVAYIKIVEDK